MTETFYDANIYKADHSTYGGQIYTSDFNTDYRGNSNTNGSTIASRIISDWKFDKQCKTNKDILRMKRGNKDAKNEI